MPAFAKGLFIPRDCPGVSINLYWGKRKPEIRYLRASFFAMSLEIIMQATSAISCR